MENSCLLEIQNRYNTLTPTEKRIADYIRNNGPEVVHMSVQELADQTGAAKSAVLRCCKSLGFAGFPDLKIALSAELSKNRQMNFSPYIVPEDGLDGMLEKVFSANVKALHDTLEWVDREMIGRLVDALEQAQTVWIYGVGASASLSSEFWYRMTQVGKNAHCLTDVLHMKLSEMNIREGDVAIGVSHSGRTSCVVDALERARRKGALTACITGHSDSPLVRNSDFPIPVIAEEIKYPIYAISSRIAHISVMDVISIALSARKYEEMQGRHQKLKEMEEALYD